MKNKEENKVEEVKTRGRKKMTPEQKEMNKKYKLLEEFKKTLGIEDPVDVGDDGTTQAIIDKIGYIIKDLKVLKKMIKKI